MNNYEFIQSVRTTVEASKAFKWWKAEHGLSIDNFEILDISNGCIYQVGNLDLGKYVIYVKDHKIDGVFYDFNMLINEIEENERAILEGAKTK